MKSRSLLIALVAMVALALFTATNGLASLTQDIPKEGKEQPKKIKLDVDSLDDKWGEVAFDHETHSLKNYNPD